MRRIIPILWLHFKQFFKSPSVLILMLVMPILFSFIFGGMAFNSEKNKPLVNLVVNEGPLTKEIVSLLKKNDEYNWVSVSEKQAKENVENQKAVAAILIPVNLQQRMIDHEPLFDLIVHRKTEDYLALKPFLEGTARSVERINEAFGGLEGDSIPTLLEAVVANKGIEIKQEIIQNEGTNKAEINLMFVGFAIMFMMFGLSGAASTILAERVGGTWSRLMISPASRLEISLGYLLAYFLMGWLQFAVLMVAMTFMFDTNWGNLSYLIPFASLVIVSVVGFGLMIAGLVKTQQQASALGAVLIVSTCMLGGVYWSIEFVPDFMQKISLAVPQSWAMSGFKEIISGSLHTPTLLKDSLALMGFSIVFFIVGLRGIKFE
jgi:ABC-2 type transport system permease protein